MVGASPRTIAEKVGRPVGPRIGSKLGEVLPCVACAGKHSSKQPRTGVLHCLNWVATSRILPWTYRARGRLVIPPFGASISYLTSPRPRDTSDLAPDS